MSNVIWLVAIDWIITIIEQFKNEFVYFHVNFVCALIELYYGFGFILSVCCKCVQ